MRSFYADAVYRNPAPTGLKMRRFVFNFTEGKYSYLGEKKYEGRKVIEVEYAPDNMRRGSSNLVFTLIPEEHQIIKMVIGGGVNHHSDGIIVDDVGIQAMTLAEQAGKIWLPQKFTLIYFDNMTKKNFYYTREFHSFKKALVETNFSFDDSGAESDSLREDVKSKTQFDMKTPVPPKE
jgi:hypothetical protein